MYRDDALCATFRVAEDASILNSSDDATELTDGRIGVVHRLDLEDQVAAEWVEIFADYELLQPFDQLGRATYSLTAEERMNKSIDRVEGLKVPTGKVLSIEKHGWRRGQPGDGGMINHLERPVKSGGYFILLLFPGMPVGDLGRQPEQELGKIAWQQSAWSYGNRLDFATVSATLLSEVIRSVETLRNEVLRFVVAME